MFQAKKLLHAIIYFQLILRGLFQLYQLNFQRLNIGAYPFFDRRWKENRFHLNS